MVDERFIKGKPPEEKYKRVHVMLDPELHALYKEVPLKHRGQWIRDTIRKGLDTST